MANWGPGRSNYPDTAKINTNIWLYAVALHRGHARITVKQFRKLSCREVRLRTDIFYRKLVDVPFACHQLNGDQKRHQKDVIAFRHAKNPQSYASFTGNWANPIANLLRKLANALGSQLWLPIAFMG